MELVDDVGSYLDPDGVERPSKAIDCPEADYLGAGAHQLVGSLCFGLRIGIQIQVLMGPESPNRFFSESPEDERKLKDLGTDLARVPLAGSGPVEVFEDVTVDAQLVGELARRGVVGIYSEVFTADSPAAKFRALWSVLELAFGAQGKTLGRLLDEFPPVGRLGFNRDELEKLRALRGKLGHAGMRFGHREVARANAEAIQLLGRLWSLVDCVVLSKKDASRSLEVDEILPLIAFINRDRMIEMTPEGEGKWAEWRACMVWRTLGGRKFDTFVTHT